MEDQPLWDSNVLLAREEEAFLHQAVKQLWHEIPRPQLKEEGTMKAGAICALKSSFHTEAAPLWRSSVMRFDGKIDPRWVLLPERGTEQ